MIKKVCFQFEDQEHSAHSACLYGVGIWVLEGEGERKGEEERGRERERNREREGVSEREGGRDCHFFCVD